MLAVRTSKASRPCSLRRSEINLATLLDLARTARCILPAQTLLKPESSPPIFSQW
jgi:hypothetical protein